MSTEKDTTEPAPCRMTHTPPFDFAQCETHDTTFPLGDTCKFDGRDPFEVMADEAQEQRARAVRAEQALGEALDVLRTLAGDEPLTDSEWGYCIYCQAYKPYTKGTAPTDPDEHGQDCEWAAARRFLARAGRIENGDDRG
jgi:hypothetical protein